MCCELVHLVFIRCELVHKSYWHTAAVPRARSYYCCEVRADAAAARLTADAAAARADQSRLETQFILRRRRLTNYTMSHGGPDEGEEAGNQGDTWPDEEDASPAPGLQLQPPPAATNPTRRDALASWVLAVPVSN